MKLKNKKTSKGDWIELVKKDCETIEIDFNEDFFKSMKKYKFKKFIKSKIEKATFKYLQNLKKYTQK